MSAKKITIKYFAALKEQAGKAHEVLETEVGTVGEFYSEISKRYSFTLDSTNVRTAVNEEFKSFETPLKDGDEVVFIPPVAGG